MVAQPTPFSALLHQLLSTSTNAVSSKGKGKASSLGSRFFSLDTPVPSSTTDSQATVEAFCKLIDQQSIEDKPTLDFGENIPFCPPENTWYDFDKDISNLEDTKYMEEQQQLQQKSVSTIATDIYDRDWLLKQSYNHVDSHPTGALSPQQLCADIFTVLRSDDSDDSIQATLVDLLGFESLDLIEILISNRSKLVNNIMNMSEHISQAKHKYHQNNSPKNPIYGTQIIVQSEEEVRKRKQQRKEQKKASKYREQEDENALSLSILGFDGMELRQARENELLAASQGPLFSSNYKRKEEERYPHVFQSTKSGSTLSMFGTRYALPAGTTREEFDDYEETTIPVPKQAPIRAGERRIKIEEMDNLARGAFKAYETLNRVQSIVYPIAYETNENMLVCAPTGAGKTDVAMLTVLRCISQFCDPPPVKGSTDINFNVAKNDFKIVYVAPMKALAAEVVEKMGKRLKFAGITVRELTGDMQLTKAEIMATQFIVTTPEKWDVITRKSTGDVELAQKVKLLIIDEVHLLHEDRGAVIESIIARTLRQVESSQSLIRIVGLSATLPNYLDVASFLRVNPYQGLFFFDNGFRPVPLEQHFIGVKGKANSIQSNERMNKACFDKVSDLVKEGHQVMVFVHARKETVKTAQMLREEVLNEGLQDYFDTSQEPKHSSYKRDVSKSRNKELKELFQSGFGIHHAGMLRSDRSLTERMFADGVLRVLCCTATLAWGVNLPAYAVVIKGTQVYDSQKGSFVDLSILDVLQIFGRAGRPQYESHGVGYILTTHDRLGHYISAITQQHPIESKFIENIVDNLNAEISLGTVTTVDEAVTWLSYTYLFVRMKRNPFVYGMDHSEPAEDPLLGRKRHEIITMAAERLARCQMIIYDQTTGYLTPKDLGRIASNFYIKHTSIEIFNQMMKPRMTEADVLSMMSLSSEFDNIKARDTEHKELKSLLDQQCACDIKGGTDSTPGKVNILLQSYISNAYIEDFALVSDCAYVAQNAGRIARALFEIALNRNWGPTASVLLAINKAVEKRMWTFQHPLQQMGLPMDIINKLENRTHEVSIEEMRDMEPSELGELVHHRRMGMTIAKCVDQFPVLQLEARIAPMTRNVLNVDLTITPDFMWNDKVHGSVEPWWIWAEDSENVEIYYSEYFLLQKKQMGEEPVQINFTVPLVEPLPNQIYIRAVSDRWLGAETVLPVSFHHLILPQLYPPNTDLLDLQPLPVTALQDDVLEGICAQRFTHFNPVQTQIFHTLYNTPHNALVGAPTGSGKTVAAELVMWWAFKQHPGSKVVYIAPMKALVKERVGDWNKRLTKAMNKKLVELTGDVTPDLKTIEAADIIITTPEKWDGISRSWQSRSYVRQVSCVIIDEIHLLGGDRGPILEVIVSRMNYIGSQLERKIRIVGLSTALANAIDLADWLGIDKVGLFNFRHSVRPVPLEIYIDGFPGKHYCPRMATMNKPTYAAIKTHSPTQPVIVFVSSRRQTRLTAQDLIAYCGMEDNPRQWLRMDDMEMELLLDRVHDESLRMSLAFGIGLHHAGLTEDDRKIVEELYLGLKIQILIATSTLAWGVNLPAHLVVIKGTEYYNYKVGRYVDYPITDVLQMMGRAGRPQFDNTGIARVFVQDSKKNFLKKFLHEPFPVESSLHKYMDDHINAEIIGGTITSKQDALDYLTWTYFYRRLQQNPTYYGLDDLTQNGVDEFLTKMINDVSDRLAASGCLEIEDGFELIPTTAGKIASYYYLRHQTVRHFHDQLYKRKPADVDMGTILEILGNVPEYEELPARCNEDILNQEIEKHVPFKVKSTRNYISPHVKAFVLTQAHISRLELPISDYITDQITVLDSAIRFCQAMIDVAANEGYLTICLNIMNALQCIKQARWADESTLLNLPHMESYMLRHIRFKGKPIRCLAELTQYTDQQIRTIFQNIKDLNTNAIDEIVNVVSKLPVMDIQATIQSKKPYLIPESEYKLQVNLTRNSIRTSGKGQSGGKIRQDGKIYAPMFPKPQYESWWMILADIERDELLAMKRVSMRNGPNETLTNKSTSTLIFDTPERLGKQRYTLFLISDGYQGLDQQVDIDFETRIE
ncbi:Sec63 Brl domain-containing protein [Halteromyces radiatus]|uniref:Sec63 Brl domain-containing protein n=1 Tax=Halteromyces radiatus TaxID=101107 RepID=UPI002220C887|nr:Sec63 Brl domain-containing protein [Halteromyces radiatus]KAI8086190.1 Sec63 Brl domain-containing protein [Halteromyces radiatus]